jgi:hypothetical protein
MRFGSWLRSSVKTLPRGRFPLAATSDAQPLDEMMTGHDWVLNALAMMLGTVDTFTARYSGARLDCQSFSEHTAHP